jgi:hypothetical protein
MNYWLLLDASCRRGVVAISNMKKVIDEIYLKKEKRYDKFIAYTIIMMLRRSNISINKIKGVGVGIGPGSLMGTRGGISTGKGICASLEIPLIELDTLFSISINKYFTSKKFIVFYKMKSGRIVLNFGENIFFVSKNLIAHILVFYDDIILYNFLKRDGPNGYGLMMSLRNQLVVGNIKNRILNLVNMLIK